MKLATDPKRLSGVLCRACCLPYKTLVVIHVEVAVVRIAGATLGFEVRK